LTSPSYAEVGIAGYSYVEYRSIHLYPCHKHDHHHQVSVSHREKVKTALKGVIAITAE